MSTEFGPFINISEYFFDTISIASHAAVLTKDISSSNNYTKPIILALMILLVRSVGHPSAIA